MAEKEKRFTRGLKCNHCGNQAPMEIVSTFSQVASRADEKMTIWWEEGDVFELLSCPACSGVILRQYYYHEFMESDGTDEAKILYPAGKDSPSGLPPQISRAYEAARRVRSIDPTNEIPQKLVGVFHGLRQLANVGAHASLGELTSAELPVLDGLCRAVLEYVYSAPFLARQAEERLLKLRGVRKKGAGAKDT